ncbi:MAG: tRNA uridine-5-carboxymethylaminomethyl(34) synthesis GTPase MnmE [Alistipes sp.]|nr:tRNA uridine-5-carboxymethylaminomethyl(34) synthesis GTPase MnmE [Alistipes sp.]
MIHLDHDIIIAPATATGGALCIIRLSGEGAIEMCDSLFRGKKRLAEAKGATLHYGYIMDGKQVVDDVVVSVFRAPHSYTGEDSIEISAHGSLYIANRIISLLTSHGARLAEAGEFTRRAFMAGKLDLSQAEAVADIIASDSRASHAIASTQMRGGYSEELRSLRDKLLHICSLLELELDFSEEDVEFADRQELSRLLNELLLKVRSLADSFSLGNALKHGVNVAIVGRPNVGKSTLLNRLIGEERAMVSEIAGTTRDSIEESVNIEGVIYRFVDTAGLHSTDDRLEQMGIERTWKALEKAHIILWITDSADRDIEKDLCGFAPSPEQRIIHVINKIDLHAKEDQPITETQDKKYIPISAKLGLGIDKLLAELHTIADATNALRGDVIVSSQRHYEALRKAQESLVRSLDGLHNGTPTDLLSEDIRQVMYHIGTITGEINSEDILKSIFSSFCIGK